MKDNCSKVTGYDALLPRGKQPHWTLTLCDTSESYHKGSERLQHFRHMQKLLKTLSSQDIHLFHLHETFARHHPGSLGLGLEQF